MNLCVNLLKQPINPPLKPKRNTGDISKEHALGPRFRYSIFLCSGIGCRLGAVSRRLILDGNGVVLWGRVCSFRSADRPSSDARPAGKAQASGANHRAAAACACLALTRTPSLAQHNRAVVGRCYPVRADQARQKLTVRMAYTANSSRRPMNMPAHSNHLAVSLSGA